MKLTLADFLTIDFCPELVFIAATTSVDKLFTTTCVFVEIVHFDSGMAISLIFF